MQEENETLLTFGARLSDAMSEAGIVAADLARRVKVSHVAVGNYLREGDAAIPKADVAQRIADALGVELRWLLTGQGERRTRYSSLAAMRDEALDYGKDLKSSQAILELRLELEQQKERHKEQLKGIRDFIDESLKRLK